MRIAEVRGAKVSGSDLALGGHSSENVGEDVELVVFSGAIVEDNVELAEAKRRGIECIERGGFLGQLCQGFERVIAVAGTHGKTTTAAMLGCVMREATLHFGGQYKEIREKKEERRKRAHGESSSLRGGEADEAIPCEVRSAHEIASSASPPRNDGNEDESSCIEDIKIDGVRLGDDTLITEACEFRRSMLHIKEAVTVITNVDFDHPDCYKDDAEYFGAFEELATQSKAVIVCGDDVRIRNIAKDKVVVSFGFDEGNDYRAVNLSENEGEVSFDVVFNDHSAAMRHPSKDGNFSKDNILGTIKLNIMGRHNALNALCAVVTALNFGVKFGDIAKRLEGFLGVGRRMERLGKLGERDVWLDYAHHPKEIACALEAFKGQKVAVVFQPHTYSRLRSLWDEFGSALSNKSLTRVVVLPVYAAREKAVEGVGGQEFAEKFGFCYAESFGVAREYLDKECGGDEVILLLGAGDVDKVYLG